MFCGEALPEHQATPTEERQFPEDLDALVAAAFRKGSARDVEQALARGAQPVRDVQRSSPDPPQASADPLAQLTLLEEQAAKARRAWVEHDPSAARLAFDEVRTLVHELEPLLPPANKAAIQKPTPGDTALTLRIAKTTQRWALFIDGPGDDSHAPALADALGIDVVTARQLALCRHPRVALRGDDRNILQARADVVSLETALSASVLDQERVLALDSPPLAVRKVADSIETTTAPLWLDKAAAGDRGWVGAARIDVIVVGQVTVKRTRTARDASRLLRRKGPEVRDLGEHRIGVVDLYGPEAAFRIVEGVTELEGFGAHDPRSTRRAFRLFVEGLAERYQSARVAPTRICRWQEAQAPSADEVPPDHTGWPVWEEHTRLCLLHWGPHLTPSA